jgi:hypothetical protein
MEGKEGTQDGTMGQKGTRGQETRGQDGTMEGKEGTQDGTVGQEGTRGQGTREQVGTMRGMEGLCKRTNDGKRCTKK